MDVSRRTVLLGSAAGVAATLAGCVGGDAVHKPTPWSVPDAPTGYLRTSWSLDPFALGSYSFLAPSTVGTSARSLLAEPVGRMFFAGEATSSNAPATTHGALESGRRAAAEIGDGGGKVIVIGAGFAGLGAAQELVAAGYEVVIVEARDRVGGRARSGELLGTSVDLGPSWIQGVENSATTALAKQSGVQLIPFDWESAVGGDNSAEEDVAAIYSEARDAHRAAERALSELIPDDLTDAERWALVTTIDHEFAASPEELSIAALDEGDEMRGGDALLAGGYSRLTDALAVGLDIRLSWVVTQIQHDDAGVTIRAKNGEQFRADFAIVTIPLGVLKAGAVAFEPELPADKGLALAGLGSGLLDKLWLSFDEVFWNPEVDVINWIDPANPGLWAMWVNGFKAFGTPTLLGFNASTVARTLATWSDDAVIESAMSALRRMT